MEAIIILAAYFVIMMATTVLLSKKQKTLTDFLVGGRNLGPIKSAMSIAATWIWAPALFVSAEKAYTAGWPGLFWFTVPNVVCLLAFIPFAKKIREKMPGGITISGFMGKVYGEKVKNLYLLQLVGLAVLSTAVQLLAGGKLLATMLGIGLVPTMLVMAFIAYTYSQYNGIQASVLTDAVQMIFILGACILLIPWALTMDGGVESVFAGMNGITGEYDSLISGSGVDLFFAFGLPTAIGLMAGPFGDQCFWQRAFSIKKKSLGKAFVLGTAVFAVVPISMGILGMIAAGRGFVADSSTINYQLVVQMFPEWVAVPFLIMLISGLLSTLDSNLCAVSSLVPDMCKKAEVKHFKLAMLVLLALGTVIASIPGISVTHLFLVYGTLRSTTMLVTMVTLLDKKLNQRGICYGLMFAMCAGLPLFGVGTILGINEYKTMGCVIATLSGLIFAAGMKIHEDCLKEKTEQQ